MSKWNHKQAYANHMKKTNTMPTATKINPDYFKTPHPHEGIVSHSKPVHGPKTRKDTKSVWRVWVRIRTTEGWTLMGYIGETDKELDLPTIRRGDTVKVDPIVLSDWNRYDGKDERPKDFSRQLHGKIVRSKSTAVLAPTATSGLTPNPRKRKEDELRDSFDCPKVWAMKSKCGNFCVGFVPNVFNINFPQEQFGVASFSIDTTEAKPVWRWLGTMWIAKDKAVEKWGELVAQGYGDKFDLITDPLNADDCDRHPADRYATLYSGQTNNFPSLVRGGWERENKFPRKKVTA